LRCTVTARAARGRAAYGIDAFVLEELDPGIAALCRARGSKAASKGAANRDPLDRLQFDAHLGSGGAADIGIVIEPPGRVDFQLLEYRRVNFGVRVQVGLGQLAQRKS
jgi:hypothetical protein